MSVLDLPPTPADADPVIVPGLLSGLGITRRRVPVWLTNPDAIASIEAGLYEIDDDLVTRDEPTLQQIEKRIAAYACFYQLVVQTYIADLEQRVAVAALIAALEAS